MADTELTDEEFIEKYVKNDGGFIGTIIKKNSKYKIYQYTIKDQSDVSYTTFIKHNNLVVFKTTSNRFGALTEQIDHYLNNYSY
jgi:hypothetical protein